MSSGKPDTHDGSASGGGVYLYSGTFTVSGNVNITGNTKGGTWNSSANKYTGGTNNHVYLPEDNCVGAIFIPDVFPLPAP